MDHKIPMSQGGHSRMATVNLQALCVGCHIEKTRIENPAASTGRCRLQNGKR